MRLLAAVPRDASPRRLFVTPFVVTVLVSCSHAPPEGFAPDPGLVAQLRDIRIVTGYARACPGGVIPASYEAVLASGERVSFSRSYDKKHPPRLHVVFLDRESPDAVSQEDGDWVTERDPLATVSTGFRLTATLRANSKVTSTVVVPPYYGCMPHTFTFSGGRGGAGIPGANGTDGAAGAAGCPPQPGAPGGNGGTGGPGASGGRGGRISVVVPVDQPFLAGLVEARSPGGAGGAGGAGGTGGRAGKGGKGQTDQSNRRCPDAADGPQGRAGGTGPAGGEGAPGPRSIVVTAPTRDIFGVQVPPGLGGLLERLQRRP